MTHLTRTLLGAFAMSALVLAIPATAQAQERTRSFEGPRASGVQTRTADRQAGTLDRDTVVTRRSDGATATSNFNRTRGDGSVNRSLEQTDFQGRTRSADTTRTATENGSVLSGTATDRAGNTYAIDGERQRTENGYTDSRSVTNAEGEVVRSRDAEVVNEDGTVTRTVETTGRRPRRAPGG